MHRRAVAAALLVLLTFAALGRILTHPFVNLDDGLYVTLNPVVGRGLTAGGVRWALTTFSASNWHPITWLSHMLDVQLFGMSAGAHHATSLLLHAASAALLFLVLAGLTGAAGLSFTAAAVFALHPLHVESVAWVAERKDVLSGVFFMLCLAAWLRYARRPSRARALAVAAVFACGLAAKPMLVTLPCVLLLLDWWPLGRLRPGVPVGGLVFEKLPLFALAAASSAVTYAAQEAGHAVAAIGVLPFPWRLANALVSCAQYLGKAVWPAGLAVFYPHPGRSLSLWAAAAAGAFLVVVTLLAFRASRRLPWVTAGWLWFLGMLVPVIGLVQVGTQAMADRYTYLPLIGLSVAVLWSVSAGARRLALPPRLAAAASGGLVLALALLAGVQAGTWRDGVTLYRHAIRVTENNWFAEANLANIDLRGKRWREAADRLPRVIAMKGDVPELHFNLGLALMNLGDLDPAAEAFGKAIALRPAYDEAELNLGIVLTKRGLPQEAVRHFLRALELKPESAEALVNLGVAYERLGREAEAVECYRRATVANPSLAETRFSYGTVLARQGRVEEAEREYRAAIALDPRLAWAHNNLGNLLFRQGRLREAAEELRAAVAAAPEDPQIRANQALIEARLGGGR